MRAYQAANELFEVDHEQCAEWKNGQEADDKVSTLVFTVKTLQAMKKPMDGVTKKKRFGTSSKAKLGKDADSRRMIPWVPAAVVARLDMFAHG